MLLKKSICCVVIVARHCDVHEEYDSLLDAWHMELFEQHESSFYAFNSIAFLREDTLGVLPIPSLKSMTGV